MEELFLKLNLIIKEYDSFIIMGHKNPDLDSLGSSLGLCEIIESFNKKAYLFLNDKHLEKYNENINQAFNKMKKDIICVNENTYKNVTGKTLLILTDVHTKERVEYPQVCDEYDLIILDHHIKNKNYIKNSKFMYIDSNLSSMSELIAYFANYSNVSLDYVIATILLAGIEIDTNSFNLKTTNKTYEAASILMDMGADSILKQELLKESMDDYVKRANYIKTSFMITDNIAMCLINDKVSDITLAEVSEELLNFEDIEASFTLGKLNNSTIGVSARSIGKIDVGMIMKEMGGGGHSSNAACQINGKTMKEIKGEIIRLVKDILKA